MSKQCLVCGRTTENVTATEPCPGCGRIYAKAEAMTRDQLLAAREAYRGGAKPKPLDQASSPAVFREREARTAAAAQAEAERVRRERAEERESKLREKGQRQRAAVLRREGMNGDAVYLVGIHMPFKNILATVFKFALAGVLVSVVMAPLLAMAWAFGLGMLVVWITGGAQ